MLILHYHLFKNAGTSVDEMLRENFGERWGQGEFPNPAGRPSNSEDVTAYLRERPQLDAFSSHTALLPLPKIGRDIFPIVFIRHPIDRMLSAYVFERQQDADTLGARLAKETDFAGYIRAQLDYRHYRQVRNFQTGRLAFNEPPRAGSEIERAMRALDSLPFVGLVEAYAQSVAALGAALAPHFPDFRPIVAHENRSHAPNASGASKLDDVRQMLPGDLFDELCECNQDDLTIFDRVSKIYEVA